MIIKNRDGKEISAILERPEDSDKIVVMCHGFTSNKNRPTYRNLSPQLQELGISVLRYDAMGHGESYGELKDITITQSVNDFLDVMEYVESLGWAKEIGVYGSSYGGFVAVLGTARYNGKIDCLALKAPAVNWIDRWERKLGEEGIKEWKEKGWTHREIPGGLIRMGYQLYEDMESINAYEEAKSIQCPALIMQGTEDESVLPEDNQRLAEAIPNSDLHVIKGATHLFKGFYDEINNVTLEFFKKHL